ncbi:SDR family NAD(P)-dependent oxidoreductase [Paenarthrobacter aromaticivorans]|uniref:SDR family oxidoreductase n=1 Tax=Paenarthrobacter aromaticivorans TaxID=2849150 RepID=A0ABS6I1Z3_9MICC|nr:SDR family oxidoreductase [Paenarthrobacter sp. MMS21-TAE1-1]MBU8864803.1 SDR family oxidoreductase [Paenarthrobacter sp. MMS21-TAE1-1]
MKINLDGKTALVTGSSQGIGLAIAKGLAEAGAVVTITGRDAERLEKAAQDVNNLGLAGKLQPITVDLSTEQGTSRLFEALPTVDILINNLGIFEPKSFFEIDDAEWIRYFEVNVLSGIKTARQYLPGMMTNGWGRVVFISSESALQIPPEMMHYGATKTMQLGVSRGLAELTAGSGVTVNSVLPGPTFSEGVSDFVVKMGGDSQLSARQQTDDFVKEHRPTSLLQRAASTEEVANLVVYLSSPQASATIGAAVSVDGGTRRAIF